MIWYLHGVLYRRPSGRGMITTIDVFLAIVRLIPTGECKTNPSDKTFSEYLLFIGSDDDHVMHLAADN